MGIPVAVVALSFNPAPSDCEMSMDCRFGPWAYGLVSGSDPRRANAADCPSVGLHCELPVMLAGESFKTVLTLALVVTLIATLAQPTDS